MATTKASKTARNGGTGKGLPTWFRRLLPPGYAMATLTVTGITPLLMKSGDYDPNGELARAHYLMSQVRKRSQEQNEQMRQLDWQLGLYYDADLGPYVPGKNVKELLVTAAGKYSKGATLKRSLVVVDYRIPLLYPGPRDETGLWAGGFQSTLLVKNSGQSGGRVWRCRPKFEEWSFVTELAFDQEEVDFDVLVQIVDRSRRYGLLDYRPECGGTFGMFEAELVKGAIEKLGSQGSAIKARSALLEAAHARHVSSIMVSA